MVYSSTSTAISRLKRALTLQRSDVVHCVDHGQLCVVLEDAMEWMFLATGIGIDVCVVCQPSTINDIRECLDSVLERIKGSVHTTHGIRDQWFSTQWSKLRIRVGAESLRRESPDIALVIGLYTAADANILELKAIPWIQVYAEY